MRLYAAAGRPGHPGRSPACACVDFRWKAQSSSHHRLQWPRAHALVDELESTEGMAVHAYLHRREGSLSNADYWYRRAGRMYYRSALEDEWQALVEGLLLQGPPIAD